MRGIGRLQERDGQVTSCTLAFRSVGRPPWDQKGGDDMVDDFRRASSSPPRGGLLGSSGTVAARQITPVPAAVPLLVGDRKQLFIDHRFIAASENVALNMNQAQKLGIVIDSSKEPWEKGPGGYFRVIDDGGKFKMYYGASWRRAMACATPRATTACTGPSPPWV